MIDAAPHRIAMFNLQPTLTGYAGAWLAPQQLRVKRVTVALAVAERSVDHDGPPCFHLNAV
jgi:hypothetical protein